MPFLSFCKEKCITVKQNECMKNHTSFKIGGECDYFVVPKNAEQLKAVIQKANQLEMPYFILGKGSNLLVSDQGIEGVVISLCGLDNITVNGQEITALAGASVASLCTTALENGLTGLEFAYGIPGSVGGGLYMNAGAYGGEFCDTVIRAEYLTKDGQIKEIGIKDMALGYRTSVFKTNGGVILSATFRLEKGEKAEIKAKMDDFLNRRKTKQPLEYPSAGSTFKRPTGYFAGALIEQNNLKGASVGGAKVSEKHAGFVINYNNATANDVKALMAKIQKTVKENNGVELEPEVIFVGRK
ncbi:MAG: UDP-N-acetylmuramate dehydrogenase [Clostridia bacterium]|nr:UDP-N-acetylmuramate dehydrogenase [Clostridia bacterium]